MSLKTMIFGSKEAGKTALVSALLGQAFSSSYEPTIGAAFVIKNASFHGRELKFEIWDTAGDRRYRPLVPMYSRNAELFIFVYNVFDVSSVEYLKNTDDLGLNPETPIILVGTHIDEPCFIEQDESENNPQPGQRIPQSVLDPLISKLKISPCHHIQLSNKTRENYSQFENVLFEEGSLIAANRTSSGGSSGGGRRGGGCRKPVLYLYPPQPTNVSVLFDLDGNLLHTYPKPQDLGNHRYKWECEANENSIIKVGGKTYQYLFWEGTENTEYDFSKGFIVEGSKTIEFLEEKLSKLGLKNSEMNDFITYWLPQLEVNDRNLISFQFERYTDHAKFEISPQPDHFIRVFMAFKKLSPGEFHIEEQSLPEIKRDDLHGFVAIEWGGIEVQ